MPKREITCPSCSARNRVPAVAAGRPRCGKCRADLPWLVDAAEAEFDQAIAASAMPVVVDLWAPWCGPCKVIAPALERIAEQRAGSMRVIKVNVDEAPSVSARMGAQSIPLLVLFKDGREVSRQVGAHPEDRIVQWIDQSLAGLSAG